MAKYFEYVSSEGVTFNIPDRYAPLQTIGKGSFGTVVAAKDTKTKQLVAVKKIRDVLANRVTACRVLREIQLLRKLRHPKLITILDVIPPPPRVLKGKALEEERRKNGNLGDVSDPLEDVVQYDLRTLYLVVEFVHTDLNNVLKSSQHIALKHIQYIMYQVISAVDYMHRCQVMHRDLKPGNILIHKNWRLKVADFGLARMLCFSPEQYRMLETQQRRRDREEREKNETKEGKRKKLLATNSSSTSSEAPGADLRKPPRQVIPLRPDGLPEQVCFTDRVASRWYRAPEVMCNPGRYHFPMDMWSVGCILAEILGRRPLFQGDSEMHQLQLMCSVLGPPKRDTLQQYPPSQFRDYLQSVPKEKEGMDLSTLFPLADSRALDLMSKLLEWNPAKRLTAHRAMKHPFIASFTKQAQHVSRVRLSFPWESTSKPARNSAYKCSARTLKRALLREVVMFEEYNRNKYYSDDTRSENTEGKRSQGSSSRCSLAASPRAQGLGDKVAEAAQAHDSSRYSRYLCAKCREARDDRVGSASHSDEKEIRRGKLSCVQCGRTLRPRDIRIAQREARARERSAMAGKTEGRSSSSSREASAGSERRHTRGGTSSSSKHGNGDSTTTLPSLKRGRSGLLNATRRRTRLNGTSGTGDGESEGQWSASSRLPTSPVTAMRNNLVFASSDEEEGEFMDRQRRKLAKRRLTRGTLGKGDLSRRSINLQSTDFVAPVKPAGSRGGGDSSTSGNASRITNKSHARGDLEEGIGGGKSGNIAVTPVDAAEFSKASPLLTRKDKLGTSLLPVETGNDSGREPDSRGHSERSLQLGRAFSGTTSGRSEAEEDTQKSSPRKPPAVVVDDNSRSQDASGRNVGRYGRRSIRLRSGVPVNRNDGISSVRSPRAGSRASDKSSRRTALSHVGSPRNSRNRNPHRKPSGSDANAGSGMRRGGGDTGSERPPRRLNDLNSPRTTKGTGVPRTKRPTPHRSNTDKRLSSKKSSASNLKSSQQRRGASLSGSGEPRTMPPVHHRSQSMPFGGEKRSHVSGDKFSHVSSLKSSKRTTGEGSKGSITGSKVGASNRTRRVVQRLDSQGSSNQSFDSRQTGRQYSRDQFLTSPKSMHHRLPSGTDSPEGLLPPILLSPSASTQRSLNPSPLSPAELPPRHPSRGSVVRSSPSYDSPRVANTAARKTPARAVSERVHSERTGRLSTDKGARTGYFRAVIGDGFSGSRQLPQDGSFTPGSASSGHTSVVSSVGVVGVSLSRGGTQARSLSGAAMGNSPSDSRALASSRTGSSHESQQSSSGNQSGSGGGSTQSQKRHIRVIKSSRLQGAHEDKYAWLRGQPKDKYEKNRLAATNSFGSSPLNVSRSPGGSSGGGTPSSRQSPQGRSVDTGRLLRRDTYQSYKYRNYKTSPGGSSGSHLGGYSSPLTPSLVGRSRHSKRSLDGRSKWGSDGGSKIAYRRTGRDDTNRETGTAVRTKSLLEKMDEEARLEKDGS